MARVRRNNSPAELNALCLSGDHGQNCGRGARFEGMLAPPGIRFGNPESIETGVLASFRHEEGFLDWLHTKLEHAYVERDWHKFVGSCRFSVLSRALPMSALVP